MKYDLVEILMNGILPEQYAERGPLIRLSVPLDERSLTTNIEFTESPEVVAVNDLNSYTPISRYSHIPDATPGYEQYTPITPSLIYDDEINTIYFTPYKIQNYHLFQIETEIRRHPQSRRKIN